MIDCHSNCIKTTSSNTITLLSNFVVIPEKESIDIIDRAEVVGNCGTSSITYLETSYAIGCEP